MSFVTLAGPKSDIDRVIDTYLSKIAVKNDLIGEGAKHIFMDEAIR